MSHHKTRSVALLLLFSGACALVYQIAWLRELRLVFGASSAATATVLGIFMGGLGLGGAVLGKRVDRLTNPLRFYASLEIAISAIVAVSPFVISWARAAYIATGGQTNLGITGATLARIALSTVILGVPTFLMGGTLPAAARATEEARDRARRNIAILYGVNTLGAVIGAFGSTFLMLEVFGTRNTLWLACAVNALVGIVARNMSRRSDDSPAEKAPETGPTAAADGTAQIPAGFVYIAAGVVGFAFLLMELVWYRMLGPILGGSTYTFGLILSVALLGIGIGGGLYSFGKRDRRPTAVWFAITCNLEALVIGLPFVFGDHLAILAELLRTLETFGFPGLVAGWAFITLLVVFPAAVVAGYQFPMLIGLLGAGRSNIGRHVGTAYASNTVGGILGSIFGGFVLLPGLSATGCWRLAVVLLIVAAVCSFLVSLRIRSFAPRAALFALAIGVFATLSALSTGPSAVWRHSGIGAGRAMMHGRDANSLREWRNAVNRSLIWQADGVEVGVGLVNKEGLAFYVNGKNDGNSWLDATTQVGSGLISAALHPNPRSAFVLGLGTGSTAGWLAQVPSMEMVTAVELEEAILEVCRQCSPVNADVTNNPLVSIVVADAREVLLANQQRYDLVVSEPSNPYRAGIASLYTIEFYEAVADRLENGGIFTQWIQSYEIDTQTVRTIIGTLTSVFPYVEVWQTNPYDMMFLCSSTQPPVFNTERLRSRLASYPFNEAFRLVWGTTDLEGFLSHFVASSPFTRLIAQGGTLVNTDDRMLVEFGFARTVGRAMGFSLADFRATAVRGGFHRARINADDVDWAAVSQGRLMMHALMETSLPEDDGLDHASRVSRDLYQAFLSNRMDTAYRLWEGGELKTRFLLDTAIVAMAHAKSGNPGTEPALAELAAHWPREEQTIRSFYLDRKGDFEGALTSLVDLFIALRNDPWINSWFLDRALEHAKSFARIHPEYARALFESLSQPFAVSIGEENRINTLLFISTLLGPEDAAGIFEGLEPHVPWTRTALEIRFQAYSMTDHPLRERALDDLEHFKKNEPERFTGF